ncbi:MAG: sigma-E processing peptidase SpoIIGA [Bacilli bacterium]|nr:sigma-E processing peptidase SpoIIGA [Bacilli bacterium]
MKIYVDILFFINLTYDFLILNAVNIVLRRNINVYRILFGSLIGSISTFSIFIPVLNNIVITILLSIVMLLITFKYKDIIYLKNNIIYFYMISVIFGGFLYLLNIKFNNFYNIEDIYNRKIIINFVGIIIISPIIYFLYIYTYKNNKVNHNNYYDLKYSIDNKITNINAFYDTGNLLKDPYKGRPIILINKKILTCDIKNKSPIYVPCNMINNNVLLKCYKPNLLIINNHIINNCLLGLWENNTFYDGIDAIISGYIGDKIK